MAKKSIQELNAAKAARNDARRANSIAYYLSNPADDGRHGKAFEVACSRPMSVKTRLAKQGEPDVSVKFDVDGKIRYIIAECKTNEGRVDSLLSGKNRAKYTIYRLNFRQKHKGGKSGPWEEHKEIPAVIIPTAVFITALRRFNALHVIRNKRSGDGVAIQKSNKLLYEWLTYYVDQYGLTFDRESVYYPSDFDGVEESLKRFSDRSAKCQF